MLAKEATKWAGIIAVVAGAVQTDQVQDLMSKLEGHEWLMAAVSAVAVVKLISGEIGKGRGDDPASPSLKGVYTKDSNVEPANGEKVDF